MWWVSEPAGVVRQTLTLVRKRPSASLRHLELKIVDLPRLDQKHQETVHN